nr:hypothetical protein CFP56_41883 [Quercus suber]
MMVMLVRSAANGGGISANRRLERTRKEREALKEENATSNSTEGGGVPDSVVAGCNHGDLDSKRKGI